MRARLSRSALVVVLLATVAGCDAISNLLEVKIGAGQGVPPIDSSGTVSGLDKISAKCGDSYTDEKMTFTVTSTSDPNGCRISMKGRFQVLRSEDYAKIPELANNVVSAVKAIDLAVSQLSFTDATSGAAFDLLSRVNSLDVSAAGTKILDKAKVAAIPTTVRIEGAPLASMESQIKARQPAYLDADIEAVVQSDALMGLPAKMSVVFKAQPTIVLGVTQ